METRPCCTDVQTAEGNEETTTAVNTRLASETGIEAMFALIFISHQQEVATLKAIKSAAVIGVMA